MKYIGNYKWLEDITKVYGPVSMHMCNVAFRYNNKIIKINVLLMGDLHTETPDIKDTKNTYKLLNFLLNIFKTNRRCFDLFVETYSPHIAKILRYKELNPNKMSTPSTTKSKTKKTSSKKTKNNQKTPILSVGTDAPLIYDTKDYKIPLIAIRTSPFLLNCRYHNIKRYGKRQTCKFPNLRYHSWDLRFTNIETDLTILSELTMTYDVQIYAYFQEYGISGESLTRFMMFRELDSEIDDKIKRLFYMYYEKIKEKVKKSEAPKYIDDLFKSKNVNADYTFYNFNKQKKLVNKQFDKIPNKLKSKLLKAFLKVYNNPQNYTLALTDFYAICRMLSKFNTKKLNSSSSSDLKENICHSIEYAFCQNIIYYGGGQHTQLMLEVLLEMFGNKSLKHTTGSEYIKSKYIDIKSFKSKSKKYPNLKRPSHFLDVVAKFYRQ
jgi:hypothetical protein